MRQFPGCAGAEGHQEATWGACLSYKLTRYSPAAHRATTPQPFARVYRKHEGPWASNTTVASNRDYHVY